MSKRRWFGVIAVCATLVLGGCGSSDEAEANTERPEGAWTLTRTLTERSDGGKDSNGLGTERQLTLTPACSSGPCDITAKPNGANGTYYPVGYTVDAPSPADNEPQAWTWNAGTSTYEYKPAPRTTSCTNAEAKIIQNAYEVTTTYSLKFTPTSANKPAGLHGTMTQVSKGVGEGIPNKCTDYTSTWTIAAAPSELTTAAMNTDIAGKYVVTENVTSVTPPGGRDPGFTGILVPSSAVEKTATGYTIAGVLAGVPSTLTATNGVYAGGATAPSVCNLNDGSTLPDGYNVNEQWSGLSIAAFTEAGKPILSGQWFAEWNPTEAGKGKGCTPSNNKGWVILTPIA